MPDPDRLPGAHPLRNYSPFAGALPPTEADTARHQRLFPTLMLHRITTFRCPPCPMDHRCNQGTTCIARTAQPAPIPCSTLVRWWLAFKRWL